MPTTYDQGVTEADPRRVAMPYQPALDGVRALAVLLVLGFHLEWPWVSGGYLGVSVFFTLSGFLITSLLLREQAGNSTIDLGNFYERRLRRLAPAALATIAFVAVAAAFGLYEQSRALRSGLLGALLQIENWVELFAGRSYADLFADPNPVAHFWSLSIEEQFYWIWPLVVIGLGALAVRRHPKHLVGVLAAFWVVTAISAPLTAWWWSPSAAYFATWARLPEILAGAVLAAILAHVRVRPNADGLGVIALVVIIAASALTPDGSGWPYQGGLPIFSLVSAALIYGLQAPGPVRSALGTSVLVWIGRRSYGIYLVHWPIFILLDSRRTGLDGFSLDTLRLFVTFVVAAISFRFLEQPIRLGHRIVGRQRFLAGFTVSTLVAIPIILLIVPATTVAPPAPLIISADTAPRTLPPDTTAPTPAPTPAPTSEPPAPRRVVVFGDSVAAWLLRDSAATYSNPDVVVVNGAIEACDGMVDLPLGRDRRNLELNLPEDCVEWDAWYDDILNRGGGDTAMLVLGQAPVVDRLVDGRWTHPCESIAWYLTDLEQRVGHLRDRGLEVVFVLPARPGTKATFIIPDDQTERMNCIRKELYNLMRQLKVPIIDLDPVLCPDENCDTLRQRDGSHVDPEHAADVLDHLIDRTLETELPRG